MNDQLDQSWEEAKRLISRAGEPQDSSNAKQSNSGTHTIKGDVHPLVRYQLEISANGYPGEFDWYYCKECRKVITKRMAIFNNEKRCAFDRTIVKHGEIVPERYQYE